MTKIPGIVAGTDVTLDSPADASTDADVSVPDPRTPTRIRVQATGIVAVALAFVAMSAFVLDRRMNDTVGQDFGALTAPVLVADVNRAQLADRIAGAVLAIDDDPTATADAGFRSSGRGWVFGNPRNDDDDSLFRSLAPALGDDVDLLIASLEADDDVLVHSCGSAFGVFVRSAEVVSTDDEAYWTDNECSPIPLQVIDPPVYFVVGIADAS